MAIAIGILLAPLLSLLKPFGHRVLWGVVMAIAVVSVVSAIVYFGQEIVAHFRSRKVAVPRRKRSWFARIAHCGTFAIIPLLLMTVVEYFTPPGGAARSAWAYFQKPGDAAKQGQHAGSGKTGP